MKLLIIAAMVSMLATNPTHEVSRSSPHIRLADLRVLCHSFERWKRLTGDDVPGLTERCNDAH